MKPSNITITKVHETVHRVVLDEARLRGIMSEAAAKSAGLELGGKVSVRRTTVNGMGAVVGSAYSAIVELVENHAAIECDFLDVRPGASGVVIRNCANCTCDRKATP